MSGILSDEAIRRGEDMRSADRDVRKLGAANATDAAGASRHRFLTLWWVALAGCLVVLYFELDALARSFHELSVSNLTSRTAARWFGLAVESAEDHGPVVHRAPHLVAAAFQIATAAVVSWMWFEAFRIRVRSRPLTSDGQRGWLPRARAAGRRWWAVGMASLVVLVFVFAMHQAYQPAVFVMAMIAIIVAAEHYSGLEKAQEELSDVAGDLGLVSDKLSTAATDLGKVEHYTGQLVEDAGLHHFVHDVYERYAAAKEIHAVVRMHDIDPLWWSFFRAADDPWKSYFEEARRIPAMARSPELRHLGRALTRSSSDTLSGCFVTDLPMPGSAEWNTRLTDGTEPLFGDLVGFVWQWLVMRHAREINPNVECGAWVSRPLCWLHATDRIVFQVLRREPRSRSAVLVVANMDGLPSSAAARKAYRSLIQWAKAEVRRYAERGCAAEDYLVAVLRYAAVLASKQPTAELVKNSKATDDLRYLLELLGARAWIECQGAGRALPDPDLAARAAAALFARAITTMFVEEHRTTITVKDLWSKLA